MTTMDVQETSSTVKFDRIQFKIQRKYSGFIIFEDQYEGPRLVSSKELGIVYASHQEAMRAMDSLVRLSKGLNPEKTIE
jgi:hypothetical protein